MDYKNGKIYMIEPTCEYDEGDVYYGHTTSTLVKRLSQHKAPSNKTCNSKLLIEKYGRDNIKIVLIKLFPCNSKDELKAEEGKYQRENKCINKNIAGRTDKEYYEDKREKILKQKKEYHQDNREKVLEHQKEHYQGNREKISEYKKDYYQGNREKILEQKKEYYAKKKQSLNTI
jgi:hypothetical protein